MWIKAGANSVETPKGIWMLSKANKLHIITRHTMTTISQGCEWKYKHAGIPCRALLATPKGDWQRSNYNQ